MTLVNEPDSTARNAIVQRDLSNVLHPIVQHKQLERQQLVVAGAHDSTIVDAARSSAGNSARTSPVESCTQIRSLRSLGSIVPLSLIHI